MNATTADSPTVDVRLDRLKTQLAEVEAQGGTGEIINTPDLPPFLLFTLAADPKQAATHFFTN